MADLRAFEGDYRSFGTQIPALLAKVGDAAATFAKLESERNLVQKLDTAAKILSCMQSEIDAHIRALQAASAFMETDEDVQAKFNELDAAELDRVPSWEQSPLWRQYEQIRDGQKPASTAGAADEDAELVVDGGVIPTRCPLTQKMFVNPHKSRRCGHTYERDAIERLIQQAAQRTRGGVPSIACPVSGCSHRVSLADLEPNVVVMREVTRLKEAERGGRARGVPVG